MEDRRKFPRIDETWELEYRTVTAEEFKKNPISSLTVNISTGGICFNSEKEIAKGTMLAIELKSPIFPSSIIALAETIWCRKQRKRDNYEVFTAPNGTEGIELAKMQRPDIILLDITVPDMDGFKVLEKLKKNKNTMAIPVIMLTARDSTEFKHKAAHLFNEAYLTKPVEISVLESTIEDVLKRRGIG